MRLDKFLKLSRIIKRRPVAKTLADSGRIEVNGRVAKAGTALAVDDVVTITYGHRIIKLKVMTLSESTKKDDAKHMYHILEEIQKDRD